MTVFKHQVMLTASSCSSTKVSTTRSRPAACICVNSAEVGPRRYMKLQRWTVTRVCLALMPLVSFLQPEWGGSSLSTDTATQTQSLTPHPYWNTAQSNPQLDWKSKQRWAVRTSRFWQVKETMNDSCAASSQTCTLVLNTYWYLMSVCWLCLG